MAKPKHTPLDALRYALMYEGITQPSSGGARELLPEFQGMIGYRVKALLWKGILEAAATGVTTHLNHLAILAAAISAKVENNDDVKAVNQELADRMRGAMMKRYAATIEHRRLTPSYQRRNRLGGTLRRALDSRDQAVGTAHEIRFLNQDRLNAEARHWARLNFGARAAPGARGPAAQIKPPGRFPMRFEGVGVGDILTLQGGPRPAFFMPPGLFGSLEQRRKLVIKTERGPKTVYGVDRGGKTSKFGKTRPLPFPYTGANGAFRRTQEAFYPVRSRATIPTRGISSSNFADAGLDYLAKNLTKAYRGLLDQWFDAAGDQVLQGNKRQVAKAQSMRARSAIVRAGYQQYAQPPRIPSVDIGKLNLDEPGE